MTAKVEALESWAIESNVADKLSLVLVLNGRKVRISTAAAEQLARALDSRRLDLTAGDVGCAANQP